MKVDVNKIQNDIYDDICSDFAEFSEKKFELFRSVLKYLSVVDIEEIITPTQPEVYQSYCDYCKGTKMQPLVFMRFCKVMKRCGFNKKEIKKVIDGQMERERCVYFVSR